MTQKAKGGRGKKAQNPYERLTVTLPPELRAWLDGEAHRQGVSRSEALAVLLAQARDAQTSMRANKPKAPAAPGAGGPLTAPLHADPLRVTGNKLSPAQTLICAGLQMSGAVAGFDGYERRWRVGFAGAPAREADLEALARLGVLEVTGEGQAAVYKLVKQQPPTPTATPHQSSTKKGPRA
ncbi:CopG family transcriptional regulator [Deinococcus sp. SM5_A1]|uniref:ribbon-helix-helix domain-containing protein n=1 Tax=Deinococcus sp. SM5_A1 TaxID=3379094 RepID=UPI00385C9FD4